MNEKKIFFLKSNPVCLEQHMDAGIFSREARANGYTVVDSPAHADKIIVLQCTFDAKHSGASDWLCKHWAATGKELVLAGCGQVCEDDPLADVECLRSPTACIWRQSEKSYASRTLAPQAVRFMVSSYKTLFGRLPETGRLTYYVSKAQSYVRSDSLYVRPCIGCKGSCTYCSIKGCRGNFWSFTLNQIGVAVSEETNDWRRMVVIGDDVGAWQDESGGGFPALLKFLGRLAAERPITVENLSPSWFSSGIKDFQESLSTVNLERICIPVQSAADNVLKRMARGYQAEEAFRLLHLVRCHAPQAHLSTHLVCGFPGETAEDHEQNVEFTLSGICDDVRVFAFSPQPNSLAESMTTQLPLSVIRRRYRDLTRACRIAAKSQKQVVRRYFSGVAQDYRDTFHRSKSFQERLEVAKVLIGETRYQCALDIGCGSGDYLPLLANIAEHVIAVDYSPAMIECAVGRHGDQFANVEYKCAEPRDLAEDLGADLLLVMGVLEYVDDPFSFLSDLRALAQTGAVMVLSYPNVWNPSRLRDKLLSRPLEFVSRRLGISIPKKVRERKTMSYTDAGYIKHTEFSQHKMARMLASAGFTTTASMDYSRKSFLGEELLGKTLLGSGIVIRARAI